MPIAFSLVVTSSVRADEVVCGKRIIMVATLREPVSRSLPMAFEFRLRFAHRIVEEMRRTHQSVWTRDDLGTLLLETLEEEFAFDWSQSDATQQFKEYLALAYVAASHVLPVSQRTF
jgi:hypothetical protein